MLMFIPNAIWVVIPLFAITIMLASFFKYRISQIIVIAIMVIFIVMELISIYFSGGFINYQFYVNLNINDIIDGLFIFKLQALLSVVVFFILLFILFKLSVLLKRKLNGVTRLIIMIIALFSLNYKNGPFDKLFEIYQIITASEYQFNESLSLLNMTNYPTKPQIWANDGKNIIVISLESFERGFLDFNDITPNLNKLSEKYTFYPTMAMSMGSSWTTASMYTYMMGMPLLVAGLNTTPLSDVEKTELVGLSDVLHKASYQTRYIIGSPTFAGIGHIISMLGINIISEKSYPGQYPDAPFGLYDKDIFTIAKHQVSELSASDQPFALFISTISTHAPNGFYDQRMEILIDKQSDNMSFVAASLDYNLGGFIEYLEQQGILENTIFYIFPDHLMMGAGTQTIANLDKNERSLYLITNAEQINLPYSINNSIYQIDLPRIIIDGAQIKSNARFLTDYLPTNMNKQTYIEQHKSIIAAINSSAGIKQ